MGQLTGWHVNGFTNEHVIGLTNGYIIELTDGQPNGHAAGSEARHAIEDIIGLSNGDDDGGGWFHY